uniref:Uncharacterized protein n=1 Tax=Knipowitschia caucasica TaxID=637954 RepID=A0AAV2KPJ5_KNICA
MSDSSSRSSRAENVTRFRDPQPPLNPHKLLKCFHHSGDERRFTAVGVQPAGIQNGFQLPNTPARNDTQTQTKTKAALFGSSS